MVGEDFDGGWKGMKWKIEERGGGVMGGGKMILRWDG